MGRELQKKKNRSSVPRVRQKPKSKKLNNPRGNAIIAANWDKSLSIAQNYRALGLTVKLNHRTGGIEKQSKFYTDAEDGLPGENDPLAIGGEKASKVDFKEVNVVKDPKTGKILQITESITNKTENPLGDLLNDVEEEFEQKQPSRTKGSKKRVMQELENLAARGEAKRPRQQSQREQEWIERLVAKHGDNFSAMSRDMKLNPMQQSAGDIKARVRHWKQTQNDDNTHESHNHAPIDSVTSGSSKIDDTKPRCNCSKQLEDF